MPKRLMKNERGVYPLRSGVPIVVYPRPEGSIVLEIEDIDRTPKGRPDFTNIEKEIHDEHQAGS